MVAAAAAVLTKVFSVATLFADMCPMLDGMRKLVLM